MYSTVLAYGDPCRVRLSNFLVRKLIYIPYFLYFIYTSLIFNSLKWDKTIVPTSGEHGP